MYWILLFKYCNQEAEVAYTSYLWLLWALNNFAHLYQCCCWWNRHECFSLKHQICIKLHLAVLKLPISNCLCIKKICHFLRNYREGQTTDSLRIQNATKSTKSIPLKPFQLAFAGKAHFYSHIHPFSNTKSTYTSLPNFWPHVWSLRPHSLKWTQRAYRVLKTPGIVFNFQN